MNSLIKKLEEYYIEKGWNAEAEEQRNRLCVKQTIETADGVRDLDIFIEPDKIDYRRYRYICYGLGGLPEVTDADLEKVKAFNGAQKEMRMHLDENRAAFLMSEHVFTRIKPNDIGADIIEEAVSVVSSFDDFIKNHYPLLKETLRCL